MAFSTIGTYLGMNNTGTNDESTIRSNSLTTSDTFNVIAPIVDYGDIGGDPETIDSTTLSDSTATNENGVQQQSAIPFTLQYDPAVYYKLKKMQDGGLKYQFALLKKQSGSLFYWYGTVSIKINGGGVNEIAQMTLTTSTSSVVEIAESDGSVDTKWTISSTGGVDTIKHGS